jgi:DNA-binding winged helix-turn-helix (wHTH) protein/TolB-like protein
VTPAVTSNKNIYRFDDVTVDAETFCVQKDGRNITLTPRAFDVLTFLIKNAGRVVEKQEIFEFVWKDTFVSDNALTKIIKEIRHALEDSAEAPRYIATVPKRGYRFIGEVKEDLSQSPRVLNEISDKQILDEEEIKPDEKTSEPPIKTTSRRYAYSKPILVFSLVLLTSVLAVAAARWFYQTPAESPSIQTIAVLPFKPLNSESRDESLEMGMAETLITRLSNLRQVVVRPMSSVRKYTDVQQDPVKAGQEVQAGAVLDGSIQKAGDRIRVTVRFIDVRNGSALWSEQFDEKFTDIFKVQDSIAERVTRALTLRLSQQEKELIARHLTDNTDAYQLYLRGQLAWHSRRQNWIEQSLAFYELSLEKDPNFALAHIGIAECYMMLSGHRRLSMRDAEMKARPSILRALEIDNSLPLAHNALAEFKYQYEYDWAGAEKEFKIALELNPNIAWIHQAYGWFLMSEGRFDEAKIEMEKGRQLDPSSLTINAGRGRLLYFFRQYDEAIQHFQNIIAVEPTDSSAYHVLYTIYEQKKMYAEAVETFLKAMTLNRAPQERIDAFREAYEKGGWEGFLRAQLEGLEKRAKIAPVEPYALANLYVRLGMKDEAFASLEKAFEQRDPALIQFKIEPIYDNLRGDTRYDALVRKIGLQP